MAVLLAANWHNHQIRHLQSQQDVDENVFQNSGGEWQKHAPQLCYIIVQKVTNLLPIITWSQQQMMMQDVYSRHLVVKKFVNVPNAGQFEIVL